MICSDSLSCLLAIESCKTQSPFILKIAEIYKSHVAIGKHVPSFEPFVYIVFRCYRSNGFVPDCLYCASSKLKVGFGFNHGGFSGLTIGAMSSKFISEFSKCDSLLF
jgi:hypothetical protein